MLDTNDPLVALAESIDWHFFDKTFSVYYSDEGRQAKPICLMVGVLLLKQIENLSDENVVLQWKRNPYYQYFCGMHEYVPALPCDSTELVKFRQRIGCRGIHICDTCLFRTGYLENQVISLYTATNQFRQGCIK